MLSFVWWAAVACGTELATSGDAPDGGDAAPAPDGGAPGDDGAARDAGADAPFCSTQDAAYCEDFDTIGGAADLDPESGGGALLPALTRELYRSWPRSAVFIIPTGTDAGAYTVYKRTFDGTKKIRVEIDWRIRSAPEVPGTLQALTLKRPGSLLGGQVSFGRSCDVVADAGVACTWYVARCATRFCDELITFPNPPFLKDWGRIFVEAKIAKDGSLAFGVVGQPPVYDQNVQTADGSELPSDATSVTVGVAVLQGTSPGIDMVFDDVVVRVE